MYSQDWVGVSVVSLSLARTEVCPPTSFSHVTEAGVPVTEAFRLTAVPSQSVVSRGSTETRRESSVVMVTSSETLSGQALFCAERMR